LDLVVGGGGGKKRPEKLELPHLEHTPTNHYKTTFQEMMRVGQGGFGSVFKVRGLVDNRLYAVKKVKLPKNDAVLKKKMMRETVMMSTLSHMNIVRYHTAWEEHVLSSELEPPSNGNDSRSSWGLSASVSLTDNTERSDHDADLDNVVPVLFIQMEWCDISVKHWLEKRTAMSLCDVHSMFVQLLMGIHHMHDQGKQQLPSVPTVRREELTRPIIRSDSSGY
jgi:serine/threonine protein kinase